LHIANVPLGILGEIAVNDQQGGGDNPPEAPASKKEPPRRATQLVVAPTGGFGTWLLAIVFAVLFPCLTVIIDVVQKAGQLTSDVFFVTTAVVAVGYGCSAEHNFYRALYSLTFVLSLVIDGFWPKAAPMPGVLPTPSAFTTAACVVLLVATITLHSVERFWWHVIWDRPFPDSLWRQET
jgi:hypothetical protein